VDPAVDVVPALQDMQAAADWYVPAEHCVHDPAGETAIEPEEHATQRPLVAELEYVLFAQAVQLDAEPAEVKPDAQVVHWQDLAALNVPEGHDRQTNEEVELEY
jgi:hypothetical protein